MGSKFFLVHFFFYKKKRFSVKTGFLLIFVQITFNQCFSWLNCAGEAVKDEIIPTRPTLSAPITSKNQLKYDSHHSAPQYHFCIPQPPQRTPFIPLAPCTTPRLRQRTTQHHIMHHSAPTTQATQHYARAVLTAITPNALGVIVLISKKR
jgi:hypothetical protein